MHGLVLSLLHYKAASQRQYRESSGQDKRDWTLAGVCTGAASCRPSARNCASCSRSSQGILHDDSIAVVQVLPKVTLEEVSDCIALNRS